MGAVPAEALEDQARLAMEAEAAVVPRFQLRPRTRFLRLRAAEAEEGVAAQAPAETAVLAATSFHINFCPVVPPSASMWAGADWGQPAAAPAATDTGEVAEAATRRAVPAAAVERVDGELQQGRPRRAATVEQAAPVTAAAAAAPGAISGTLRPRAVMVAPGAAEVAAAEVGPISKWALARSAQWAVAAAEAAAGLPARRAPQGERIQTRTHGDQVATVRQVTEVAGAHSPSWAWAPPASTRQAPPRQATAQMRVRPARELAV